MAKGRSSKAKASVDDAKKDGTKKVSIKEVEMNLIVEGDETAAKGASNAATAAKEESTMETPMASQEDENNSNMNVDDKDSQPENVEMQDDEQQEDVEMTNDGDTNAADKDATMEEESPETNDSTNDKEEAKDDTTETNADEQGEEEDEEEEEETEWDLKRILSLAEVNKEAPIKCGSDECTLAACSLYVGQVTGERWYGCIDCQDEYYGGWPEHDELPDGQKALSKEHIEGLIAKCSNKKRPAMPPVDPSLSPKRQKTSGTNTITPLGSQATKGSKVTPTPAKAAETKKPKQNATLMKKHAEWQNAAIKAGGPDARIIVKKDLAKKVIFELLYDKMKPMNITQIHTELKATVPSPILKSCLDDMALDKNENQFYDSDDDDAPKKAAKKSETPGDDYAGSLAFKGGRNANSSLYYVDHTKQKNNGNGLLPDDRNELANAFAKAQEEASVLKAQLQSMSKETTQLLSEPTNEEATATLEKQELEMNDIREQLEAARQLKVNEKYKKQIKKRIEAMVAQWRKRKRLTMEFLHRMEESTEGTISAKKCLNGDGQIDVESDETVIKNSIAYAKKKRSMVSRPQVKKAKVSKSLGGRSTGLGGESSLTNGLTADPNFVGVQLSTSGQVERVYLGDEE